MVEMAEKSTLKSTKNIVILGGSYAGISTAHYVLKHVIPKIPESDSYEVVLISASTQAFCRPACPRALISDEMFAQQKLFVDIERGFEQYAGSFRFIHGTATGLDHVNRTVLVDGKETIPFYSVVIATGASTQSPLFGLNKDEEVLRASWAEFRNALPAAKRIVIAGGGPTGVETAGELGEYLNGKAGWFGSKNEKPNVRITLVTAASQILPDLRPAIASKGEDYLARVGVTVIRNARVKSVAPEGAGTGIALASKSTLTLEDGKTLEADIYIPATGTKPNTDFIHESLRIADGRVETNASTLRVDKAGPRIYAIGDVASSARPAVHNILGAIPTLGANMKRDLLLAAGEGESAIGEDKAFKEDMRETQIVPIGKSKGVGSAVGYRLPSFMVWLIKGRDYWLWTTGDLWSGKHWFNKEL